MLDGLVMHVFGSCTITLDKDPVKNKFDVDLLQITKQKVYLVEQTFEMIKYMPNRITSM